MKKDSLIGNSINTDAESNLKGFGMQKLRAAQRLLEALKNDKKCIFCTIEYVDDVIEIEMKEGGMSIQTEQNKNYTKSFSLNSDEIRNSLRIFFDTWRKVEEDESISFVFYTNTGIAKENCVGVLKQLKDNKVDLPNEAILKLLVEGKYDEALPFVVPVLKEYYIEQHKKHTDDITYYENLINSISNEKWREFLSLIEFRFSEDDESEIRKKLEILVSTLCKKYNVEEKYSNSILASILDLIESNSLEKNFLNRVVHVSQVEGLFKDFARQAIIEEKLDPLHTKWDELEKSDIRNLNEKILSVSPKFDESILEDMQTDCVDGKYEQEHYGQIKEIKAYNYRIYRCCSKVIKKLLKDKDNRLTEHEVEEVIEQLVEEAEACISDKSKTYHMPYLDRDMIYKTILILFQECFLAFD